MAGYFVFLVIRLYPNICFWVFFFNLCYSEQKTTHMRSLHCHLRTWADLKDGVAAEGYVCLCDFITARVLMSYMAHISTKVHLYVNGLGYHSGHADVWEQVAWGGRRAN